MQFLEACTFLSHKGLWAFFFYAANDEVIVYFPTGGFLGDGSLSAKLWRKPQFLPAEWKVEAKVWIHVGDDVTCPRLCVFHRSQMLCIFLTHTITRVSSACLESATLMPLHCFVTLSRCSVLFRPLKHRSVRGLSVSLCEFTCSQRLWGILQFKCQMPEAWAIFGGISVFPLWSMS